MKVRSAMLLIAVAALFPSAPSAHSQVLNIFGNSVPHNPAIADSAVTLGVKFYSTQSGTIAGIRFYRGYSNSHGYTVKLFSAGGTLLASKAASGDTCTLPCWEQINFTAPISVAANTTYVAAYYTSNGNYADDEGANGGLTNGATSGPLVAPASSQVGGNGVYTYSTGFPRQTWHDSNYYVDIAFTSNAPTLLMSFNPANPSIAANTPLGSTVAAVNVSWSDGSQFTGTLGFAPPYSNDAGAFALSGSNVIVNPSGPGVSGDGNTVQNITVQATQ